MHDFVVAKSEDISIYIYTYIYIQFATFLACLVGNSTSDSHAVANQTFFDKYISI